MDARPNEAPGASDIAIKHEARAWMADPYAHFGFSTTRIHSVPRDQADAVQLAAMNLRLEERRQQIRMLAKLAEAQGISKVASLNDMAPLLLAHNVYKSYPISLLAKQKYGQLTTWLSRLTPYDLSHVDVTRCASIDEWLDVLQRDTPLDVATSSGSGGTCSFFPKSKRDYVVTFMGLRIDVTQAFGTAPTDADIHEKMHVATPLWRDGHATAARGPQYIKQVFCKSDDAYLHTAFNFKLSTDMQWLGGRLRAAAAKGDISRVEIPPALLARRAEWDVVQRDMPRQQADFIRRIAQDLRGKKVFALGPTNMFYPVAKRALEEGVRRVFAPGSRVMGGGGAKGLVLPPDAEQVICEFFGVDRMTAAYGMTEINTYGVLCEHGLYHMPPWVTVFVLDLESGQPLPREGTRTGRVAFFDMTHDGTWGGVVSGDHVTVDWDMPCPCGRTTVGLPKSIQRLSELQGGDDKITCAATPDAQAEAMDYLTSVTA